MNSFLSTYIHSRVTLCIVFFSYPKACISEKTPCLPLQCDVFNTRMCFMHGTLQMTCPGHYLTLYMAYQACLCSSIICVRIIKKILPTLSIFFGGVTVSKQYFFLGLTLPSGLTHLWMFPLFSKNWASI